MWDCGFTEVQADDIGWSSLVDRCGHSSGVPGLQIGQAQFALGEAMRAVSDPL